MSWNPSFPCCLFRGFISQFISAKFPDSFGHLWIFSPARLFFLSFLNFNQTFGFHLVYQHIFRWFPFRIRFPALFWFFFTFFSLSCFGIIEPNLHVPGGQCETPIWDLLTQLFFHVASPRSLPDDATDVFPIVYSKSRPSGVMCTITSTAPPFLAGGTPAVVAGSSVFSTVLMLLLLLKLILASRSFCLHPAANRFCLGSVILHYFSRNSHFPLPLGRVDFSGELFALFFFFATHHSNQLHKPSPKPPPTLRRLYQRSLAPGAWDFCPGFYKLYRKSWESSCFLQLQGLLFQFTFLLT